jgi:hypothetical protein
LGLGGGDGGGEKAVKQLAIIYQKRGERGKPQFLISKSSSGAGRNYCVFVCGVINNKNRERVAALLRSESNRTFCAVECCRRL